MFLDGGGAARCEFAESTDRSDREISFLCVTGRRVLQELSERLYALSKDFFRRESVERTHVAQPASDIIRGHIGQCTAAPATTLGDFTRPGLKETFSIVTETPPDAGINYAAPGSRNPFAPNLWAEEPKGWRDAFLEYWNEMGTLSAEMMRLHACARARRGAFRRQHRPACLGLQRDALTRTWRCRRRRTSCAPAPVLISVL